MNKKTLGKALIEMGEETAKEAHERFAELKADPLASIAEQLADHPGRNSCAPEPDREIEPSLINYGELLPIKEGTHKKVMEALEPYKSTDPSQDPHTSPKKGKRTRGKGSMGEVSASEIKWEIREGDSRKLQVKKDIPLSQPTPFRSLTEQIELLRNTAKFLLEHLEKGMIDSAKADAQVIREIVG